MKKQDTHFARMLICAALAGATTSGCSGQMTNFGTSDSIVRAIRVAGQNDGDFTASPQMSNTADSNAEAENGTTIAASATIKKIPQKEGVEPGRESLQDKLDSGLIGACIEKLKSDANVASFKVVNISGTNQNNSVLFEDLSTSAASMVLLRISLKNVNNSTIQLLNPKSTYCIDMQVKNMNQFKFKIACESKVGFVRLVNKNANKASTEVNAVQCN